MIRQTIYIKIVRTVFRWKTFGKLFSLLSNILDSGVSLAFMIFVVEDAYVGQLFDAHIYRKEISKKSIR